MQAVRLLRMTPVQVWSFHMCQCGHNEWAHARAAPRYEPQGCLRCVGGCYDDGSFRSDCKAFRPTTNPASRQSDDQNNPKVSY